MFHVGVLISQKRGKDRWSMPTIFTRVDTRVLLELKIPVANIRAYASI